MKTYSMIIHASFMIGTTAVAHPGGLDSSGGHRDRRSGGYHYHGGGPSVPKLPAPDQEPDPAHRTTARTSPKLSFRSSAPIRRTTTEPIQVKVLDSKTILKHYYARVALLTPDAPSRSDYESLPLNLTKLPQSTIYIYASDAAKMLGIVLQKLGRDPEFRASDSEGSNVPSDPWVDGPFAYREWKDATGSFTVVALFHGRIGDSVSLLKKDGTEIKVLFEKLSLVDQKWIRTVGAKQPL